MPLFPTHPRQPRLRLLATRLASAALIAVASACGVRAETFQRIHDLAGLAHSDPGKNAHGSLSRPDSAVWSYWILSAGQSVSDSRAWLPLPHAEPSLFRERAAGAGAQRFFIRHEFAAGPEWTVYWNFNDEVPRSPLAEGSLLVVFTAPAAGDYTLEGDLAWRHWPGPGVTDASLELLRLPLAGEPETLSLLPLRAPSAGETTEPVPGFASALAGRGLALAEGDRLVFRLQSSRSRFRGVRVDDSGLRIVRATAPATTGAATAPHADPLPAIVTHQLLGLLSPATPVAARMRELAAAGRHTDALDAFRDAWFALARGFNPREPEGRWLYAPTNSAMLREGRLATLRYGGSETVEFQIGPPGSIDWNRVPENGYHEILRDLPAMNWANALAETAARETRADDAALWIGYWADLATRWPEAHQRLLRDPAKMALVPKESIRWANAAPLYFGWRLTNFFGWLPHVAAALPAEDAARVPSLELARTLVWFASEEAPRGARILANPIGVPNQQRILALGLLEASAALQWLRPSADWAVAARDALRRFSTGEILPDGGSLEQSLNYNQHLPAEIERYLVADSNLPPALRLGADLREFLLRSAAYRYAFMDSVRRPDSTLPSIGKNNPYVPLQTWAKNFDSYPVSRAIRAAFDDPARAPGFTSVYLPWSGYAALRTGWARDDAYAFFQNSRPGLGHYRESALRLDVSAFGAELLVNSGAEQYSPQGNFDAYFNSSLSQNSIAVDGFGQLSRPAAENTAPAYESPIPARWFTSPALDFVEGRYTGLFGGWNLHHSGSATPRNLPDDISRAISDVSHHRQVVFVKQVPLWLVIDRLHSATEHEFTQIWNYAPDFAPAQLVIDPLHVRSTRPAAPNLDLLHVGTGPAPAYTVHHGIHQPDRILGWVSKDRAPKAYDFAPAPDLHASWRASGPQVLVTALVPSLDANSRVRRVERDTTATHATLDLLLADGARIVVTARSGSLSPETGPLRVEYTAADGARHGLVLDAADGETDHAFVFGPDESAPRRSPIAVPAGFHWQINPGRVAPDYTRSNRLAP